MNDGEFGNLQGHLEQWLEISLIITLKNVINEL